MDKMTETISKKAADYVAVAQPIVDEHNALVDAFTKKAHQVAGALVGQGVIAKGKEDALVDKLAADIANAPLDLVLRLAGMLPADSLGGPADEKAASADLGPFERLALYGSTGAQPNTGLVE